MSCFASTRYDRAVSHHCGIGSWGVSLQPGRALVIGTSEYEASDLPELPAAANDAEELADILRDPVVGGYEVEALRNPRAREAAAAIRDFLLNADQDRPLLLHLACHAISDDSRRVYLASRDTDPGSAWQTGFAVDELADLMSTCRASSVVLILDACMASASFDPRAPERWRAGNSKLALLASSYGLDRASERHSPFTHALIDALRDGHADINGDGFVDLQELFAYVSNRLPATGIPQPVLVASRRTADFLVAATSQAAHLDSPQKGYGPPFPEEQVHDRAPVVRRKNSGWLSFIEGLASVFDPFGNSTGLAYRRRLSGWTRIQADLAEQYSKLERSAPSRSGVEETDQHGQRSAP
ncbi:caspase family protein [Micromonospora coerulea]|uniref:caspase family protein n=1 Tax=Micromonospora coerulea TaxID=47856 RepID=UPI00227978DB|nr:caspase family protein [Micromonospora veneta]